jgi:transcriptional regulator with XRE-family HTH domain
MSLVAERFAENLSHYRERSGLSVEALAAKAETHRTQVSQYLNGKALPRLDVVVRLAGSLNVSVAQLVEGITWEPAADTGQYKVQKGGK